MASEFVAASFDQSDTSTTLRFVLSHIWRYPWLFIGMLIGAFSNAALASAVPYFIGEGFNALVINSDLAYVALMGWAIAGSQLSRGVLQLLRNYSAEVFAQRTERDVRDELYASLLGKSMAFHDGQTTGDIMSRVVNDVREMNLMMSPGMNLVVGSSFFLLVPLVVAPLIHPALILSPLLFTVLYVLVQFTYVQRIHRIGQEVRAAFGGMNVQLAEALDGVEIVKGASQEQREIARFDSHADEVRDRSVQQADAEARYLALLVFGLVTFTSLLHSIILWNQGQIEVGDIVNYVGQIALFNFPVFSSSFSLSQIALGYASAERILKIIRTESELDQNRAGHSAPMRGELRFEEVSFTYTEGEHQGHVIEKVSFYVKPGQTVALVGQTGSGKSTIAKLINRIYDTHRGRVLIDGVDVRDWNLESLRSQISIIEQEIFLFSRSIAENIRYGKPEASMEDVIHAAQKAQAHDFIMSFPEGYETIVGQRGVTLSGGQRQRLAIARAFLTDPRILILDDSTSAIDSATEDLIQKAIWAAAEGRTTLIITHRLSQIRWADHIVVLKQGRIAAQGSHDDLLAGSEPYRRIFARYEGPVTQPASHQDAAS